MARIDQFFEAMEKHGGSDLHLTAGEVPRLRVDGELIPLGSQELTDSSLMGLLEEICPEGNWAEFNDLRDTDFAYEITGLGRFRANYFYDLGGPGAVFRIIPIEILTAEQLNLSVAIIDLCKLHKGLVLVTGPTGSGKSTTLSAMIDWINRNRRDHIITIEDPVEFVHPNKSCLVNQREIGTHTQSFKSALRAALREDPDIILCGELRDLETVHIALEMAETGHLVFGTLHTNTAASTVDRIIDQFPSDQQGQIRTMLASSLKGVISQTLLKKKTGKGRVAAMEVLLVTTGVASNIREGKTHQIAMAMQTGGKLGMVELNTALLNLVKAGTVDAEHALSKAIDQSGLRAQLQRFGLIEAPPGAAATGTYGKLPAGATSTGTAHKPLTSGAPPGATSTQEVRKSRWFSQS